MSGYVLSENCKLYWNTGSYTDPSWSEIDVCQDVTLELSGSEVDVTTRASGGWTENVPGSLDASVDFDILYDTGLSSFIALRQAFFNKTAVEVLVLDGDVDGTASVEGLRATCMVSNFSRNESLGEAVTVSVSLKPVRNSDASPEWFTQ